MSARDYVKSVVRARTGIAPQTLGDAAYDAAIEARCRATGVPLDAWIARLDADEDERRALVDAIVIPETWFFRDERPFSELARHAVRRLNDDRSTYRVLSVPCSTGEEAYSIAIALGEVGVADERFQVDAVDVSSESIARARRGVFRSASFRGPRADEIRSRWCVPVADGYELLDDARGRVRFRTGNVLDPLCLPADVTYAAIFCRNLLIYFDRPTREAVVRLLASRLEPGGVFFVGHAESLVGIDVDLERLADIRAFGYQKVARTSGADARALEPSRAARPRSRPISISSELDSRAPSMPAPMPTPLPAPRVEPVRSVPPPPHSGLELARRLADSGSLERARDEVAAAISREGPSVEAYFLLGIVAEGEGKMEEAERAFSRALYLDAEHYESLVHMALLRERRGDASSERFRARAARASRGGAR